MKNSKRKSVKSNIEKIRDVKPKRAKRKTKKENAPFKSKYHFRRYKIYENGKRHPKLIVGEIVECGKEKYEFMGLTESKKSGTHTNIPIENPKEKDIRKANIRKELRKDKKTNFSGVLQNYNIASAEDEAKIDAYLNKKRNNQRVGDKL